MPDDKRLNEVIRVQKCHSSFVLIDKGFLENAQLSWKAKGILTYLLSKPDNWKVIVKDIVNHAPDGKYAVYNGLNELKALGYYEKRPIRDNKGHIVRWESVVYESPAKTLEPTESPQPFPKNREVDRTLVKSASYPLPSFPDMDNQELGNQLLGNQERSNNYISNNEYTDNPSSQVSQVCLDESNRQEKQDRQDKEWTDDIMDRIDTFTELVKKNIAYNDLAISRPYDMLLVDEFVSIIIDTIFTEGKTVRIDGENKPRALVVSVLMKLSCNHIEHAIDQFKSVSDKINKKKQYILTMLYNCKLEVDSHYTNQYNHDKWN